MSAPADPVLRKRCMEPGDGQRFPKKGQMIGIHYVGYIAATGIKFDSSYDKGEPFVFQLGAGHVIRGFEEAVKGMSLGARAAFIIPAELGYGSRGSGSTIPPGSDLIFDLKLLSIQDPDTRPQPPRFRNSPVGGSLSLLEYFVKLLRHGGDLDLATFHKFLADADINATCNMQHGSGKTLLHIVSELADQYPVHLIHTVIQRSVDAGANLDAVDGFGETPLTTVLCMLEEEESEEGSDSSPPEADLFAALICYLELDQQQVHDAVAARVQHQVDRISDQRSELWVKGEAVIALLEKQVPKARLAELRQGYNLASYLVQFYDTLKGADLKVVSDFLDAGADPAVVQAHSGCNSLHLVALNAYGEYAEVFQVLEMLLRRRPEAATAIDKSKFTAFALAADYKDTASQFKCKPNASAMLALGELLPQYDVEAGLVCLKVDAESRAPVLNNAKKYRFMSGDRVKCWVQAAGTNDWEEGVVVSCGYREECWPQGYPGAAYEVKLDIGDNVFVLSDTNKLIRAEHEKTNTKTSKGKRFIKQQTTEGRWETLDIVTGKVRPSSPPDSD